MSTGTEPERAEPEPVYRPSPPGGPRAEDIWRRNLVGILIAAFVSLLGINFVFPFMPLYVQDLGIKDTGAAAAWTGNIILVSGLAATVVAPFWGQLADRRGRKPMLLRALIGAGIALALMALARGVWELLAYRTMFSMLAGTIPASNSLIAAHTPPAQLGQSMGMLQTAVYLSNMGGPVLGGVLAGVVGLRPAFVITGGLYVVSGVYAGAVIHERFTPPARTHGIARGVLRDFAGVLRNRPLRATLLALVMAVGANNALYPLIPVYIQRISHPGGPTTGAGITFGAAGLASALAAVFVGRALGQLGYRRVVLVTAAGSAVLYAALLLLPAFWPFVVVMAAVGGLQGMMLPAINALIAMRSPRGREGGTFGVVSSFQSLGFSVFPFIGGHLVEGVGLRSVFVLSAAMLTLMLLTVWLLVEEPGQPPASLTV
jgi:DHA1 family multidrug resistance protein-like MFS transporter